MMALCLVAEPANQNEFRIDLLAGRGLMDSIIAEPNVAGFTIYEERNGRRLLLATFRRRSEQEGLFVAKGPNGQEDTINLSAEIPGFDSASLKSAKTLVLQTKNGSEIRLARSGAVTYLTDTRTDRTYAVHGQGSSNGRRATLALTETATKIFALKYADPNKLADILKPILGDSGQVSADTRTRSLVVSAPEEKMPSIDQIIAKLDVEVPDRLRP